MDYALTNKELSQLKSALTRAKKKGPKAVQQEVATAYRIFKTKGYPDCWHEWQIADDDARFEINNSMPLFGKLL